MPVKGNQRFCCRAHRLERTRGRPAERECEQCGASFVPVRATQRFCCSEHRVEHRRAQALAERECESCGAPFVPVNAQQRFCCTAHREHSTRSAPESIRDWRRRVAELEAEVTREREQLERRAA